MQATLRKTTKPASFLSGEEIGAIVFLAILVMGVFFPPESYFAPQNFALPAGGEASGGFPFGRLGFAAGLVWLGLQMARDRAAMLTAMKRSALPLAYVVWMAVSAAWTADPVASFNRGGRTLITVMFAIYMVERFSSARILRLFTYAGAIAILASLIAVIAMPAYGYSALNGYRDAWRGATIHKNALGALMSTVFILASYAYATRATSRGFAAAVVVGSLFMVVMSKSATSLIAVVLAIMLMFVMDAINRSRSGGQKAAIAVFTAFCAMPLIWIDKVMELVLPLLGRSATFTGRADVWKIVGMMIQQKPIWGYGNGFWGIPSAERTRIWTALNWAAPHAHNNFLDIWFQLGIVGVILAVLIFAVSLGRAITSSGRQVPTANLAWTVVILTTLFRGISETVMVEPGSSGLFWVAWAYAGLAGYVASRRRVPARPGPRPGHLARPPIEIQHGEQRTPTS